MSIAIMEEEIVGVSVRLNQTIRQQFPLKTLSFIALNFQRPEGRYFKTGSSFVSLTWLLTGISEGKILILARSMWNT